MKNIPINILITFQSNQNHKPPSLTLYAKFFSQACIKKLSINKDVDDVECINYKSRIKLAVTLPTTMELIKFRYGN